MNKVRRLALFIAVLVLVLAVGVWVDVLKTAEHAALSGGYTEWRSITAHEYNHYAPPAECYTPEEALSRNCMWFGPTVEPTPAARWY